MKKIVFLFAFLFTVGSSFISCSETRNEDSDVELRTDDAEDAIEDAADDIEDEF